MSKKMVDLTDAVRASLAYLSPNLDATAFEATRMVLSADKIDGISLTNTVILVKVEGGGNDVRLEFGSREVAAEHFENLKEQAYG